MQVINKKAGEGRYRLLANLAINVNDPIDLVSDDIIIIVQDEAVRHDFCDIFDELKSARPAQVTKIKKIVSNIFIDVDAIDTQIVLSTSNAKFIISDITKLSPGVTLPDSVIAISSQLGCNNV